MNLKTIVLVCSLASLAAPFSLRADEAPAATTPSATPSTATPRAEGRRGGFRQPGFDALTADEKAKFTAASETARKDPKVQAAQEKAVAALKESRDALDAAILAADPSVEPILKKLQEAREKARTGRGGAAAQ